MNHVRDSFANSFTSLLHDLALKNHVKCSTFTRSANTLDLVIDRYTMPIIENVSVSSCYTFSDHCLVTFSVRCQKASKKKVKHFTYRECRDMSKFSDDLKSRFRTRPPGDISTRVQHFNSQLKELNEAHLPSIEVKITENATAPWFSGVCNKAKAERRRAKRYKKAHPSPQADSRLKAATKQYVHAQRNAKSSYCHKFLKKEANTRKGARLIASLLGKPQDHKLPNRAVENPLELSIDFHRCLNEKAPKIRNELLHLREHATGIMTQTQ